MNDLIEKALNHSDAIRALQRKIERERLKLNDVLNKLSPEEMEEFFIKADKLDEGGDFE